MHSALGLRKPTGSAKMTCMCELFTLILVSNAHPAKHSCNHRPLSLHSHLKLSSCVYDTNQTGLKQMGALQASKLASLNRIVRAWATLGHVDDYDTPGGVLQRASSNVCNTGSSSFMLAACCWPRVLPLMWAASASIKAGWTM